MGYRVRKIGDHLVLDGHAGAIYRIDTVDAVDENLRTIRSDSPDVDRLLDARRIVGLFNTLFGGGS